MTVVTDWGLVALILVAWVVGILYGAHLACKHLQADYSDLLRGEQA